MKKLLLGIITFSLSFAGFSQVEIYEDGTGPDVSGTVVTKTVDAATSFPLEVHFHVYNNTGSDQQWSVARIATVTDVWKDDLCWPPYCFIVDDNTPAPENVVYYTPPYTESSPAPIIVNGTDSTDNGFLAELKPRITPDMTVNGTGIYKYYLTDFATGDYVDSVELHVTFAVGLDEIQNLEVNVSPNPVNDILTIDVMGDLAKELKLVDVLGNVVYTGKGGNVDVSGFNNGVYFLIAEDKKGNLLNQKIMVRH